MAFETHIKTFLLSGLILWLKDKNTSIPHKLKLSKFAWGTEAVQIPNKQQQLLDFVCGLLVNRKKHSLQGSEVLLTWKTLLMFLQASGQTAVVKPSILQAVVEDLGKSKRGNQSIRESDRDQDLQDTVVSCACFLLALPSVASAQFELLCSVLSSACSLKSGGEAKLSDSADRLLLSSLPVLMRCQRAHLNQSQVLACSVHVMDKCPNHIAKMLVDFLLACLLHSDHQEAYEVYLRHSCGEPAPGQPKQPAKVMTSLFTALANLIGEGNTNDASKRFIPLFLQSFFKENRKETRVCFLMLKRLVKLMTPVIHNDQQTVDEGRSAGVTDSMKDNKWLEGVGACIGVCQNDDGLDLFSASRQSGDVLTWFSKLMQLVIAQDRDAAWFDFMRHVLGLNHLVVEKSWIVILRHTLTASPQKSQKLVVAQDQFLCEMVSVYVRMRRASDLLSTLIESCLTISGRVYGIQESGGFYTRLCKMFSEVPLTTVLDMWDKMQGKTSLLVHRVASLSPAKQPPIPLPADDEETSLLSQLDWILSVYTALLGNARLFDHRSSAAFSGRISTLVDSVGEEVLAPLYKTKEVRRLCPGAVSLLKAWSDLQVMLLPRWRESGVDKETPANVTKLRKWIKAQDDTLTAPAVSRLASLCQLLPLVGTRLSNELLSSCADLTLNILKHGQGPSWTKAALRTSHNGWLLQQEEEITPLSLARNLISHPATRELRVFQKRIALQAWAEILKNLNFRPHSPAKKRKKAELGSKTVPNKITSILTDDELNLQDVGEISFADLSAEVSDPHRCIGMIQVLLCLDLEYLPDVNLRCQVGAVTTLLACKKGPSNTDQLKQHLERLFVRSLSVPNTSRLFKILRPSELLQMMTDYFTEDGSRARPLLEVCVQAIMSEHGSVLHMPGFVKQVLSELSGDTTCSGSVKFQLLSLVIKHCHKYLKKVFHVREVAEAAREVYFCVARYVIKHGLDWYKNIELKLRTPDSNREESLTVTPRKKKRKRVTSGETGEGQIDSSRQDNIKSAVDGRSVAWDAVLGCVTEVLDLWDEQVAETKVNQHLELVVAQIVDIVQDKWVHKVEKAELLFIQSCCYCQLRSHVAASGQETATQEPQSETELRGGLCFLKLESYPKLWAGGFHKAQQAVSSRLQHHELSGNVDGTTECNAINGSKALHRDIKGVGATTDVLCALLESADPSMFDSLLDSLQGYLVGRDSVLHCSSCVSLKEAKQHILKPFLDVFFS
ncbi:unhealthy ribosome biogenesis protein 2 homolog [Elysia marginata]|uniref:Unhealthy ribosome biogenesis protein 2 homolog n=1 Tax=Elysia marginata TaxID=1093978 RepID=A0AAV4GZD0_9GAST|nr:unhealthy ribosome biogenesis protein 2 homolog [Elysia marginata]